MLKTILATSLFLASVLGVDIDINSMSDFEAFKTNPGDYGVVRLYTDLDFTGKSVNPIENFQGMFYGNGHVIKNLEITSNALNIGLFGSLSDSTVKDLIVDGTCKFKGTYASSSDPDDVSIGSVVGKCARCTFENIINHAPVSYEGASNHIGSAFVGGIAGTFSSESSGAASMKNVANYGAVSNKLAVENPIKYAAAGGISGYSVSIYSAQKLQFTNCLNYGTITTTHNGDTVTGTGGILGVAQGDMVFKNVVSAAACSYKTTSAGSVLGLGVSVGTATFENCYVPADVAPKKLLGGRTPGFTSDDSEATPFESTKNIFDQLNSETGYANVWVNNKDAKTITFQANGNTPYVTVSKVIIAPVLFSDSTHNFKGWYSDDLCTSTYAVSEAATADITLHGGWQYMLSYKANGGDLVGSTQSSKNVIYMHKVGTLPGAIREGYSFAKWTYENSTEGAEVNADTVFDKLGATDIYVQWNVNQYTITFNFNNEVDEPLAKEYDFGATVTYPENPTRFEYTFQKWVSDYSTTTLNNKPMPAQNVTVNATWEINKYDVIFVCNNDKGTLTYNLPYDAPVTYPILTKEGYTFAGWDNDTITTTPSGGITITANWTINTYYVTFDFNNGTDSLILALVYGASIEYPQNVTKKGYNFVGWQNKKDTMPAENFTSTVEFAVRILTYNLMKENKIYKTINYTFGEVLDLPDGPKKTMYKFDKWCLKSTDICEPFTAAVLPDGLAYFEAKYKIDTAILAITIAIPAAAVIAFIVVLIVLFVRRKKRTARRKVPKKKDVEMDS